MPLGRDREECPLCPQAEEHTTDCLNAYDPTMHAALLNHGLTLLIVDSE